MRIGCPKCKQAFDVAESFTGKRVKCSACGTPFTASPSIGTSTECPICSAPVAVGAVICLNCGLNLETGVRTQTHVREEAAGTSEVRAQEAEAEDEEEEPSLGDKISMVVEAWAPGLLRPLVLIVSTVFALIACTLLWLTTYMVREGASMEALAFAGLGLIFYAHTLTWILTGELQSVVEGLADFDLYRWLTFLLLLFTPYAIVFMVVGKQVD